MNHTISNWRAVVIVVIVMCFLAPAHAQKRGTQQTAKECHVHPAPETAKTNTPPVPKLSIPDVDVLDQEGRTRKFFTDLVKDKIVIVNFVFTTCKLKCPLQGVHYSELQAALGERLGRDVFLISVSTDPETDSPDKLKAWGAKFKAKDGWTLVTGRKEELTPLLKVFTGDGPRTGYHTSSVCIVNGDKRTHRWAYGLETPERIIQLVDELKRGE